MADTANIDTLGEGNPSNVKTGNTAKDVRDNRDESPLEASGPDTAILAAWASYCAMRDTLDALPDDRENDAQAEFEAPYWAECDKAELTILEARAATPAGAAIKIKVALAHMLSQRRHDDALRTGDLATLADPELDWPEKVLVSALQSLESMGA